METSEKKDEEKKTPIQGKEVIRDKAWGYSTIEMLEGQANTLSKRVATLEQALADVVKLAAAMAKIQKRIIDLEKRPTIRLASLPGAKQDGPKIIRAGAQMPMTKSGVPRRRVHIYVEKGGVMSIVGPKGERQVIGKMPSA